MPQFAANLTMLFNEVPFMERFEAAAKAGFKHVEFLFPYAFPAADIKARLDDNGLSLVLHNLPAGDWDAGERGIACHPDRVEEFRVPVVIEIILERVTNIAMGTEIDNVVEFEELAGDSQDVPTAVGLAPVSMLD